MAKTFAEIQKTVSVMKIERGNLADRINDVLDRARINADDTCYKEKAQPESEYDRIAVDTIREILSYSNDIEVQGWFKSVGIDY